MSLSDIRKPHRKISSGVNRIMFDVKEEGQEGSQPNLPTSQALISPSSNSLAGLPLNIITPSLSADVCMIATQSMGSVPTVHPMEAKTPTCCIPDVVYPPNYNQADGGHGWIVLLCAFLVYFVNGGVFSTLGIILPHLISGFDADRVVITMLPSVQFGLCLTSGLFAGPLVEIHGCRLVCIVGSFMAAFGYIVSSFTTNIWLFFVTYSIIPGIGLGFQYIPAAIIVQEWFDKRRSIATGIQSSGSGVGGIVFPLIANALLDSYGWRGFFLLLGAVLFHVVPIAICFAPGPLDMAKNKMASVEPEKQPISHGSGKNSIIKQLIIAFKELVSDLFDFSVLKELSCVVVLLGVFLFSLGYQIPYIFLPSKSTLLGLSPMRTALFISIFGIADVVGRLSAGWIGNFRFVNQLIFFSSGMMIGGVSALMSAFFFSYPLLVFHAATFGLGCGIYNAMQAPCLVDLLGMEKLARAFGLLQVASGIALLGAPPIAALIFKYTGNINLPFMIGGGAMILASVFLIVYNWIAQPMEKFIVEPIPDEDKPPKILVDSSALDNIASNTSIFTRRGIQSARHLESPSRQFGSSRWFMSVRGLEGIRPDGVTRDASNKEKRRRARAYLPGTLGSAISINSSRYFSSMYFDDALQSPVNSRRDLSNNRV